MARAWPLLLLACLAPAARADSWFVTVAGLGGEADYEQRFAGAAADIDRALKGVAGTHVTTLSGPAATAEAVRAALRAVAAQAGHDDVFVLTLVGHGSWDGAEYRFNLPGPDLAAPELAALCDRIGAQRQLVVLATSASGGAVPVLQKKGRALVTATKSGTEKNATVFGRYWAEALLDPAADTDKNQQLTALEAFRFAAARTADFYVQQKRLATEHAQFVEGDAPPARAEAVGGDTGRLLASVTLLRNGGAAATDDPARRGLMARKEQLEQKIDLLKYQRAAMAPEEYKSQLTQALVELAKVQGALDTP